MNKLDNRQNAEHCMEDIRHMGTNKVSKPQIGLNFIYSDFLYLYSDKPAPELKHSFMNQVIGHRNSIQKLIEKSHMEFQIQHAFNYMVWNQLYVGTNNFNKLFEEIKRIYKEDRPKCDRDINISKGNMPSKMRKEYLRRVKNHGIG